MPMGQAHTKALPVTYFLLTNASDIVTCLTTLLTIDFYGAIMARKDQNGAVEWSMQVTSAKDPRINFTVHLNDVLLWDTVNLTSMRMEDFSAKYTIG